MSHRWAVAAGALWWTVAASEEWLAGRTLFYSAAERAAVAGVAAPPEPPPERPARPPAPRGWLSGGGQRSHWDGGRRRGPR